jgi:hypothetical protein
VRIDVNDLSSEYTEEAYTYYYFGCVINLIAMVPPAPLPTSVDPLCLRHPGIDFEEYLQALAPAENGGF